MYSGERDNFIDMYEIIHRLRAHDCTYIYSHLRNGYLSIKRIIDASNEHDCVLSNFIAVSYIPKTRCTNSSSIPQLVTQLETLLGTFLLYADSILVQYPSVL